MPAPKRVEPSSWKHYALYRRVKDAVTALPGYFRTETYISGVNVTDVHTLATALGATIEDQVVNTLNNMREAWDPEDDYPYHRFIRQAQTFPDVVLVRTNEHGQVLDHLLGIELKGWFLLAKEGEPNLRFKVSSKACNPWDLVVVVPWALSQVISGKPEAFAPWIESAKYAAEFRNYWWQEVREAKGSVKIQLARGTDVRPYPIKSSKIDDEPQSDKGRNFGRIARTGIMDAYLDEMKDMALRGIRVRHWISVFEAFRERHTDASVKNALDRLRGRLDEEGDEEEAEAKLRVVRALEDLLG